MNTTDSQPVEICGRDATLRFDDIAHDVTRFEILPEEHNRKPICPRATSGARRPASPITWWTG